VFCFTCIHWRWLQCEVQHWTYF